ncbi:alanine racemase [Desulfocicer vacuolatum DSM 3385]|uniref:Alanine racemase n=1 Tax=Desulfocicer vacuolatum DSM 3385 TaxID=1121400 RepID=A0A1W2CG61_9BACT|nr:alanine racemase [Desulfocicer vacuolatum]SMC83944.1 alanine racemase [Desulfocicer vacuolatum DSM 3385]
MSPRNTAFLPQTAMNVDLSALSHNLRELRKKTPGSTRIMAVIKADAYGHGAVAVARAILDQGVSFLCVSRISEAVELRNAAIDAPILLFGNALPSQVPYMIQNNIRATVASLDFAQMISREAVKCGGTIKVHIKVDTGMGRLGILPSALSVKPLVNGQGPAEEEIASISRLQCLDLEGIYTHFANADSRDKTHTMGQIDLFSNLIERLEIRNICPPLRHSANSAAILELPGAHYNMVRAGIALYGLWPSDEVDHGMAQLKPVMSITSTIIHLKKVPRNFKISYGSTHVTPEETIIATVPIGYADGYNRLLSSRGQMIVKGIKVPVVGRVCMDFTMIDVGTVPNVQVGEKVTVLGHQGNVRVSADDIARLCNTINYEVVASLNRRIPIRYIHGKENR